MRIARALAFGGIDSRRKCEEHIRNGAVTVNGEVVRDLGRQVDPEQDVILFRGRPLASRRCVYYLLYKPVGYTTTASDPHAGKTVYELLPKNLIRGSRQPREGRTRVFPVGRLDRNSSGLLLFTNDGGLAHRLTHPRYQVGKWYEVRLDRPFYPADARRLLSGIRLEEGIARVLKVHGISRRALRVLIAEGKKREIRRIFEALGYEVVGLTRTVFGPLRIGKLRPGEGRYLTSSEVLDLKRVTDNPHTL